MVPMVNAMSEVPLELESNLIVKAAAAATVRLAKGKGVAMLSTRPTRSPRQRRLPWPWRSVNGIEGKFNKTIITNRDGAVKVRANIQLSREKEFEEYTNILAMSSVSIAGGAGCNPIYFPANPFTPRQNPSTSRQTLPYNLNYKNLDLL